MPKLFKDTKAKAKQYPIYDAQQTQLRDRLMSLFSNQYGEGITGSPVFQAGESYLTNLLSGKPESFEAFEAPYKQQFQREVIPEILGRFGNAGNEKGSSGLYNSLAQAGSDLTTRLAALRGGLQQQSLPSALAYGQAPQDNLFKLLSQVLSPSFNTGITPGAPSTFSQFAAPLLGGLSSGFSQGYGARAAGIF